MGVPSLNDLAVDGTLNTTNQPAYTTGQLISPKNPISNIPCQFVKVRGPFVQTLCIEKDSYMDAI